MAEERGIGVVEEERGVIMEEERGVGVEVHAEDAEEGASWSTDVEEGMWWRADVEEERASAGVGK
jgi:hypothetical protein